MSPLQYRKLSGSKPPRRCLISPVFWHWHSPFTHFVLPSFLYSLNGYDYPYILLSTIIVFNFYFIFWNKGGTHLWDVPWNDCTFALRNRTIFSAACFASAWNWRSVLTHGLNTYIKEINTALIIIITIKSEYYYYFFLFSSFIFSASFSFSVLLWPASWALGLFQQHTLYFYLTLQKE